MTIQYEPENLQISFIFRWKGTIFPLVLSDPMFWFLLITHIALLKIHADGIAEGGEGLPPLDWNASTVAMGLLTFFVVFYGNHCYQRYFDLHGHCIGLARAVTIWAHLVRANFSSKPSTLRWNMMRTMLGGMHIHYAYLHRNEDEDGTMMMGVSPAEWRAMRHTNLFTRAEVMQLSEHQGNMSLLAASWALGEVKQAILRDRGGNVFDKDSDGPAGMNVKPKIPRSSAVEELQSRNHSFDGMLSTMPMLSVFNSFEAQFREFTYHCLATMEILLQPVPFPYFHILKLLLLVALLILSYALVELLNAQFFLSLGCYTVSLMIMLGLQGISIGMSDPFGNDEVSVERHMHAATQQQQQHSMALTTHHSLPSLSIPFPRSTSISRPLSNRRMTTPSRS